MRLALSILTLLCSVVVPVAAQSPTKAPSGSPAAQLERILDSTSTLQANFAQRVTDERGELLGESRGKVYLSRPGRFRWDYQTPTPQLIVGDGERVWVFDVELEQVTVKAMDQALGNTPALLLTQKGALKDNFSVRELADKDSLRWVELRPKAPDPTFEKVRIGLGGSQIQVMEMADNFGQLTRLWFSETERNENLDPSLFRFVPPAGVDVIEEQ